MAIANETIDGRPECIAYIAGRIFYGLDSVVYYTQLLEGQSLSQLDKCYQKNDPTAEQLSDVLDTDGGTISVNGAGKIIQLEEFMQGVLVFADNGVWYIGGEGGFKATSFYLQKLTTEGCIGANTVVKAGSIVTYWAKAGVYVVAQGETGAVEANNISDATIQTFYERITTAQKLRCTGHYNAARKVVEWLYSDTSNLDNPFLVNSGLVYDLRTNGWFVYNYNSDMKFTTEGTYKSLVSIVSKSEGCGLEEDLCLYLDTTAGASSSNIAYGFATKTDTDFKDFGTTYPTAYVETGYEALGKPSNKKTAPYAVFHFKQTEENWIDLGGGDLTLDKQSSCLVSAKWDWNNSSSNGRFSPQQEAYKFRRVYIPDGVGAFDSGELVINTKVKLLGRGNAVSLRLEQSANKDFQLLGYTIQYGMKGGV